MYGGGEGALDFQMGRGVPLGVQNLTLSQTARHTNTTPCHNIPLVTKNFHMHTLLQYCTPRIDPVLLLFYSKKK